MITQTLKGFRDFLPVEQRKRQYVIGVLKKVFESFGFEPLETPSLEYEEVLMGKYGEEGDKLMYRFQDNGGRKVALRYDQTVPLSRVVAQYQNELPIPFKRYQIQPVWRAENTQKGRYREFLQCDADTVGLDSSLSDAEMVALAVAALQKLGFPKFKILINDREIFKDYPIEAIVAIDKLKKIGPEGVVNELIGKSVAKNSDEANVLLNKIEKAEPTKRILDILGELRQANIDESFVQFSPTLARGMDYYTGMILEAEIDGYTAGSVAGGGRYDNLIGMFAGRQVPATGFSFGFDRLMEAIEQFNLFPSELGGTKVLVTIFSPEFKYKSIEVSSTLRSQGINTELYLDENAKMEKQLKYADKKQIPYVVIIGKEEAQENSVTLRNMKTREQRKIPAEELVKSLK